MKITSEGFTKLVGPNGERFTNEGEYRLATKGEYYLSDDGKALFWNEYRRTISFFIVLTPHPSTVKPAEKIVRLPVKVEQNLLWADNEQIESFLSRADFRGFVFTLLDGTEVPGSGVTLLWANPGYPDNFNYERDQWYTVPIRPSFVEVDR